MRRPCLILIAAVLSGTLYGLREIPFVWKFGVPAFSGILVLKLMFKCRGKDKRPLYFFICFALLLGLIAWLRTTEVRKSYETPEAEAFFEKYEASNPGEFDYALYLKTLGICTEEDRKQLKERSREAEGPVKRFLGDLSESCQTLLEETFSENEAGILAAMLLGNKNAMKTETKELYQSSGISHLLAVSGLHVSMIGMGSYKVLKNYTGAGVTLSAALSAILTGLYCAFTGASASSLRAALMLILGFFATSRGRSKDGLSSLCLAAVILLFRQPYLILQSGFQLSFTAMLGVYLSEWLNRHRQQRTDPERTEKNHPSGTPRESGLKSLSERNAAEKLRASFISCTLISMSTLPVIASCYYKAPLYSILLNMAVIPLMSGIFISGGLTLFLTAAVHAFSLFPVFRTALGLLALLASTPARVLLKLYRILGNVSLKLPLAQVLLGKPSSETVFFYYLVFLLLILTAGSSRQERQKKELSVILAAYLLSFPILKVRAGTESYVRVLDVGQGDCFHIHSGKTDIVIDCGSSGSERAGSRVLEPYLLSEGIEEIDVMIVSHADADHTNGLLYLLEDGEMIRTSRILLPALAQKDPKYSDFTNLSRNGNGSPEITFVKQGDRLSLPGGEMKCIYSEESETAMEDTNRESSVWLLELESFSMLFTGDITRKEEEAICSQYSSSEIFDELDVLKAAHHGSKTASSAEFLDFTSPKTVVLSYGKNNRYKHPSGEVVERILERNQIPLSTAESGSIIFYIGEENFCTETWNGSAQKTE